VAEQLNPDQINEVNKTEIIAPFLWLLELEVPSSPATRFRLVAPCTRQITFGTDFEGIPVTYYPFDFEVGTVQRDAEGNSLNLTVRVSNITREIQSAIELYEGLVGQPARAMLVSSALLSTGIPLFSIEGDIITNSATAQDVEIEIGERSAYRDKFPALSVQPHFCSFPYGGNLCGYDTTRSGALLTCSKLLEGENGCREHGDDEVAASLERQHPARFGGFPGVPRAPGAGL